jgi:hypothetical protein
MDTRALRTSAAVALLATGALLASVGCSKTETPTTTAGAGSTTAAANTSAPDTKAPDTKAPGTTGTKAPGTTAAKKGTSTTTGGGDTTTSAKSASDQKAAEASLLTESNVPPGFTSTTPSTSSSKNPFLGVPECAPYESAIKAADTEQTAKAKAAFQNANKDQIESQVEVYTDAKVAKDSAAVLTDPGFPACIEAAFKAAMGTTMPAGASIDSLKVTTFDVGSTKDLGVDSATGFKMAISLSAQGQSADLTLTISMVTVGRSLTQVTTQSSGTPIEALPLVESAAANLVKNAPS